MSLSGPLLGPALASLDKTTETSDLASDYGIQADRFGMHPDGHVIDAMDLCLKAPDIVQVRLPAGLVDGTEFVTSVRIFDKASQGASIQFQVTSETRHHVSVERMTSILQFQSW